MDASVAIVAEGDVGYLREVRRALRAAGIDAELLQPPPERRSS
jgi:hypothetical protein